MEVSGDRDISELASEIRLLVGRLSRRMRQEAAGGLTPSELSALASIEELGPLQLGDLARAESVAAPTMTRAADRLEERGLVRRAADPSDGRAVLVETTAAGRRALRDLRTARAAFLARRLETLEPGERVVVAEAASVLSRLLSEPTVRPQGLEP